MLVVFDTETYRIIPHGLKNPPPVVYSYASRFSRWLGRSRASTWLESPVQARETMRAYLEDPDCVLAGHNISFDFGVTGQAFPELLPLIFEAYRQGRVRDTRTRQKLIDIKYGRRQENSMTFVWRDYEWQVADYSLAGLEKLYLGKDRSADKDRQDAWRLRYAELDGVPLELWPHEAKKYPLDDAEGTYLVLESQARKEGLDYWEPLPNEQEQAYKGFALHLISSHGLRTDPDRVTALEQEVTIKFQAMRQKMLEEGLYSIARCNAQEVREGKVDFYGLWKGRPNQPLRYKKNTKVLAARVAEDYRGRGLEPPISDKGNFKADKDALSQCENELLKEAAGSGTLSVIRSTFIPTLKIGISAPIMTSFDDILNTGRISSYDPNMNNAPRDGGVRDCFKARDGFVYCSTDYDCAELRSGAQNDLEISRKFGNYPVLMAEFFQKEPTGDPHLVLASTILGITVDEAKKRKKAGDKTIKGVRQMCKAINFGLPGGMGVAKLIESARKGYGVILYDGKNPACPCNPRDPCESCRRSDARWLKEQWLKTWPEKRYYFAYINRLLNGKRHTTIQQFHPKGHKHRVRGMVGYCDGANTLFQGRTADGAAEALTQVAYECYVDRSSPLYGCRIVGFFYDEIFTELREDVAHEAAMRQAQIMVECMNRWTPDIPATCTPALCRYWYKQAEAVYDEKGKLIPWEPKK